MQNDSSKRTLAVLQPGYLPWIGFFDQMERADVFIVYDDVQYDKNGWRNRNRIKSPAGPHWLTVPVHVEFLGQKINEVRIDKKQDWHRKHLETIKQFYKKAPFLSLYFDRLSELLRSDFDTIADLDFALIQQMKSWLAIEGELHRSSKLDVGGDRNERLLNFCLKFKANRYLSGNAAKSYLDVDLFARHGIEVCWQDYVHPSYPQLHGEFVPYLCILDLLLNCGEQSREVLVRPESAEAALNTSHHSELALPNSSLP